MSLDAIAEININLSEPPFGLAGFSTIMVAALLTGPQDTLWDSINGATVDVIEVNGANWQSTMVALGVSSSEDLYVALSDAFAQTRKPSLVLLGRRFTPVAQVQTITVNAAEAGIYTTTINGNDYTFTATAETVTQIRDAILAAVVDSDVADTTQSTDEIVATANVPGVPFTLSVTHSVTPANITAVVTTASVGLPEDIANWRTPSDTFTDRRDDWYFLLETTRINGNQQAAAVVLETMRKVLIVQTSDAVAQTSGLTDIGYELGPLGLNLNRTMVWWSQNDDQFVDFAIAGKMAVADPGSETWHAQSLSSVVGTVPTSETNLNAKNYNWLESFVALNGSMTVGGRMASGQFTDLIIGRDWLHNLIQVRTITALRDNPRLPYTNTGGDALGAVIEGALQEAAEAGLVDGDTIVVNVPRASAQTLVSRATRHFPNITWSATLQGAIHSLETTGSLTP